MFYALGSLLFCVLALLGYASTRPDHFRYVRTVKVRTSPDAPFGRVADLHAWEDWSPWAKLDPAMKTTYAGPRSGVGANYAWDSANNKVGAGSMTVTAADAHRSITLDLAFNRPFKATNVTTFTFEPDGADTTVSWTMEGRNNIVSKVMSLFMNMEKLIGADFEKGLAALKSLCETSPASVTAPS